MTALDRRTDTAATARPRPGPICRQLLAAMEGSEGRRKRRKRNTTPDAIGMEIKRALLARATEDDPEPDDFEAWLLEQCLAAGPLAGATRAMAMEVRDEWRTAVASTDFRAWLAEGAPSEDVRPGSDLGLDPR
ncbi:MAG: hypothetical protein ACRDJW_08125 [Thermomicrobiales bacterium]